MKLSDVFTTDYLSMMEKHRDRIQKIINSYDVVIFMARKAICLYKALVANEEITENSNCTVLSSRVITFDCNNLLKDKKIAVVDDVVVRGKSIQFVMEIFDRMSLTADVFVMAEEKGNEDSIGLDKYIRNASQQLEPESIDEFSNQITLYIHLSGISYNIDHPIFQLQFDSENACYQFLAENRCTNLTDGIMRKHNIERFSLHFSVNCEELLGDINTLIKIRFIHKIGSSDLIAVPLVLLSEIDETMISSLFETLVGDEYKALVINDNERFEIENKYKVVQYILSECLMFNFARCERIEKIKKDIDNERIIFTKNNDNSKLCDAHGVFCSSNTVFAYKDDAELQEGVSRFYDLLFEEIHHEFFNGFGGIINEKTITREEIEKGSDKLIASCVLDIMIDKGILIPSIVHTKNKKIIRAYKLGEIFKLHKKGIQLFHYMIYQYFLYQGKTAIFRTEFEKLCVLFLKQGAYSPGLKAFTPVNTFDDDCFSIGYSKFGPRVSNNRRVYSVESRSALSERMFDLDMIQETKHSRMYIISYADPPQKEDWKEMADAFAYWYSRARKVFAGIRPYGKIRTFIDFLTLLSIGIEKRNKLYSLIAELYLFVDKIDLDKTVKIALFSIDHMEKNTNPELPDIYKGIMDGINSGIWKFRCYQDSELIPSLLKRIVQISPSLLQIKLNYTTMIASQDQSDEYDDFIRECGELLCEIGSAVNTAYIELYGCSCPRLKETVEESNDISLSYFKQLKERAEFLIDRCNLCIDNDAVKYKEYYKDILVIYDPKRIMKKKGKIVFREKDPSILQDCFLYYEDIETQLPSDVTIIKAKMSNPYQGLAISGYYATGHYFEGLLEWIIDNLGEQKTNKRILIGAEKVEEDCIRISTYDDNQVFFCQRSANTQENEITSPSAIIEKQINNYYTIEGDNNIIGDENKVDSVSIQGDDNTIDEGNTTENDPDEP